jgi:hypothetical protein
MGRGAQRERFFKGGIAHQGDAGGFELLLEIGISGDNDPASSRNLTALFKEDINPVFGGVDRNESDLAGMKARVTPIRAIPDENQRNAAMFLLGKGLDPAKGVGQILGRARLLAEEIDPDVGLAGLRDGFPMVGKLVQNTHRSKELLSN